MNVSYSWVVRVMAITWSGLVFHQFIGNLLILFIMWYNIWNDTLTDFTFQKLMVHFVIEFTSELFTLDSPFTSHFVFVHSLDSHPTNESFFVDSLIRISWMNLFPLTHISHFVCLLLLLFVESLIHILQMNCLCFYWITESDKSNLCSWF